MYMSHPCLALFVLVLRPTAYTAPAQAQHANVAQVQPQAQHLHMLWPASSYITAHPTWLILRWSLTSSVSPLLLSSAIAQLLASSSVNSQWTAPADAGLPMGTPDRSVVGIELHYNNPDLLTGLKDQGSGFRIFYTGDLRPHDVGLITLGQDELNIPPGVANVPANVSVCPSACTKRFKGPLKLLDGFFHMHGLGKSIITRR